MNWKSLLLKPTTALIVALSTITPWAANTSDEQEGASKLFCIKLARDFDYNSVIQLSQQDATYEPGSDESCFEKWFSPEGNRTAYTYISELIYDSNNPPIALELTSDIDFGGYNAQTRTCNEDFWPFELDVSETLILKSVQDSAYTIKGICFISPSDEASFGGNLIGSIQNVRFEGIRLESLTYASLFGTGVEEPDVNNVYVSNATISAPVAGLFVSSAYGLYVTDFEGSSIMVHSIPDMHVSDSANVAYPSMVALGGLAGTVSNMYAVGVSVDKLSVSNNASIWDGVAHFIEEVALVEAHIGGIVGHTERVEMVRVGLDESLVDDDAATGGKNSYLGGLVGSFTYDAMVWFQSTYSFSDISCSINKDPFYCKAGYIAGLAEFPNPLNKGDNDISLVSNFHYTIAAYDSASGMFGEAYCDYLREYMPDNQQNDEHISCAYEFNTFGELSVLDDSDDENSLVPKTYAYGCFRSATESTYPSGNFDPDTYLIGGDSRDAASVGVIEQEYMQGRAFADVLNRFNSEYGNTSVEWIFDGTRDYPYVASTYRGSAAGDYDVHVTFVLDCIENTNCLTSQEVYALENFYDYSNGSYTFTFVVDKSGRIADDAWLRYAYNLTESNPDRDSVYWDPGPYQPFSVNNTYDYSAEYHLTKADVNGSSDDTTETQQMAIAFFGKGIDYGSTIVELVSYDGKSVKQKGDQIDLMSYSGGNHTVEMRAGKVMQIAARNPETIDGSAFKGWVVRAALALDGDIEKLRRLAFGGREIPVDDDGYFNLYSVDDDLFEDFKSSAYGSKELLEQDSSEVNLFIVLAIFPKGFEAMNELEEIRELAYPALLRSGNAIQLNVKTDKFVMEEVPFVKMALKDLNDSVIAEEFYEYPNGGWPDMIQWEHRQLDPGMYLMTAEIFNGLDSETREWDFEVEAQIAGGCNGCWYMVSLANVDLDDVKLGGDVELYWWNESNQVGRYWQYERLVRKSDVDVAQGYWYNSLQGAPLKLNSEPVSESSAMWVVDSVYSGWNMVQNPYSWYIDVSDAERDGMTFFRWDPEKGGYDHVKYLKPFEAIWVKTPGFNEVSLSPEPVFVDEVDADGNTVPYLPLKKTVALAKADAADAWSVQVSLKDAKGKVDSWNVLGVEKNASSVEEPPAGMGDFVNLSIVDAGRRLAKSVKAKGEASEYEWNVELSATSTRVGFLKVDGVDALRGLGLRVFVTIDGVTTEVQEGADVRVNLSATAKVATIRIAGAARKVVAGTLENLRARDMGGQLQVGFDASEGLAGLASRVDLVDMQGHVVNTVNFKTQDGYNEISMDRPGRGLYAVRAVAGGKAAVQKILLK